MARPRFYEERASQYVKVRVTPSQKAALREVASENRANVARVVRDAVNEYVADYRERRVFRGHKT